MAGEEQVTGTSVPGRHVNMENEFARTGAAPTHQIAGETEATVFFFSSCLPTYGQRTQKRREMLVFCSPCAVPNFKKQSAQRTQLSWVFRRHGRGSAHAEAGATTTSSARRHTEERGKLSCGSLGGSSHRRTQRFWKTRPFRCAVLHRPCGWRAETVAAYVVLPMDANAWVGSVGSSAVGSCECKEGTALHEVPLTGRRALRRTQ